MTRLPSRVLPILDPSAAATELVAALEGMAAGGAAWIEYRDKAASDRLFAERARELVAAGGRLGVAVLINDRVEIALAVGAAGVHLGQDDLPADEARRLLGDVAIVGISVDTVAEARAAAALPVDYVALGPVFATSTKADAGPPVGLDGVAAVAAAIAKPLVAVGGIDAESAEAVIGAGAACVAAVSALLGGAAGGDAEAIAGRTRHLIEAAERGAGRPW